MTIDEEFPTPQDHINAGDAALKKALWYGNTPQMRAHESALATAHYAAATAKLALKATEVALQHRAIEYEPNVESSFDDAFVKAVHDVVAAHKKKEGDDGGS